MVFNSIQVFFYLFWGPVKDISSIIMMIVEIVTLCTKDWWLQENLYHLNNADIQHKDWETMGDSLLSACLV